MKLGVIIKFPKLLGYVYAVINSYSSLRRGGLYGNQHHVGLHDVLEAFKRHTGLVCSLSSAI